MNSATGALGPANLSISDEPVPTSVAAAHFIPAGTVKADLPLGYVGFCVRVPDQCKTATDTPEAVSLTVQNWAAMSHTNDFFNAAIRPMDDERHYGIREYWTIPTDGYGDCEDAALAKRKSLMEQGFSASALRIAVADTPGFGRHAVLTVVTDKGDYVLDNMTQRIVPWDVTGYTWIERQDPKIGWVSLQGQLLANASADLPVGATR